MDSEFNLLSFESHVFVLPQLSRAFTDSVGSLHVDFRVNRGAEKKKRS